MLEAILAVVAGLLIGSFLNVCVYRLPRDLSVVTPKRSYCPRCEEVIAWYDNVPLLSWILLRGRCRHCGQGIPARYLLVEAATGALFLSAVLVHGWTSAGLKYCLFAALQVGLIFSDLEERILPDEMTLGGALAGLAFAPFVLLDSGAIFMVTSLLGVAPWVASVSESIGGAVITAGALYAVGRLYSLVRKRDGLGLGDVKMVGMIGAFLGLSGSLLTLIVGSTLGSVVGLVYIAITKRDSSTYELPFGSFLGVAAVLVAIYGDTLIGWYSRLGN
ncbi:MAG TPA: prepilin peptidase [Solibacterales bacterium]|nr:prepilin peptidase [Bryobacterales bacterium]